jgi:hypothetical protein
MRLNIQPTVFNTLLDAEPSGESMLLSALTTKVKIGDRQLREQDWIDFNAALRRVPEDAKDATVNEFLSSVPWLGEAY